MAAGCSSSDSDGMTGTQAYKSSSKAEAGGVPQPAVGSEVKGFTKQTTLSNGTLLLFSLEDEVCCMGSVLAVGNLLESTE